MRKNQIFKRKLQRKFKNNKKSRDIKTQINKM